MLSSCNASGNTWLVRFKSKTFNMNYFSRAKQFSNDQILNCIARFKLFPCVLLRLCFSNAQVNARLGNFKSALELIVGNNKSQFDSFESYTYTILKRFVLHTNFNLFNSNTKKDLSYMLKAIPR